LTAASTGTPFTAEEPRPNHKINNRLHRKLDKLARKQLARDLVSEIRDADHRLKVLTAQIAETVAATGSRVIEVDGIGPVVAGRLLARTHRMSRFATAAAFASYAGVAPVEVSSADRVRHRLPRGDRQLSHALHIVAVNQIRMPGQCRTGLLRHQDRGREN
jgi:transposase